MKKWFLSLKGAITLSVIALISEAWRSFLDAMFVLPVDIGDEMLMNLAAVIFTILFGVWAWSLILAARGSRGGLLTAFFLNLLVLLAIPFSWLIYYCDASCRATAGIFNIANTLNLISGLLAGLALGIQVWQVFLKKSTQPVSRRA